MPQHSCKEVVLSTAATSFDLPTSEQSQAPMADGSLRRLTCQENEEYQE